jgi:hypothetical protein
MAVAPSATATIATCPQCQGSRKERAVAIQGGNRVLLTTDCGVCGGTGILPIVDVNAPDLGGGGPPPPQVLALWPFLIPVALFVLFFLYLWL